MSTPAMSAENCFRVLTNQEGRHALWPAHKSVPGGWTEVLAARPRTECLRFVAGAAPEQARMRRAAKPTVDFGLMFFGSTEDGHAQAVYEFIIQAARFADEQGFAAVWLPERHFTRMGGLFPNPAVLQAALARETRRIRLRAGSVVLPLQHPLRVAEEWAVVDNLSGGRVELSFAPGWNSEDFVLAPDRYATRYDVLYEGIRVVERLWHGDAIAAIDGTGKTINVRTYPAPVQKRLVKWITAAGSPQSFQQAGAIGANLLTHLFDQSVEELADKIRLYRQAYAQQANADGPGRVAVALHTFVGDTAADVRTHAFAAYRDYLKANLPLLERLASSRNIPLEIQSLQPTELDAAIEWLYEKFLQQRSLLGTPDACADLVARLAGIGVQEIACLIDFGPAADAILASLPNLAAVQKRFQAAADAG